jgi:hypothetical protein
VQIPKNTFYKMVKARGGWIEGDIARFPSVAAKDGFNRDCDDYASRAIDSRRKPAKTAADLRTADRKG